VIDLTKYIIFNVDLIQQSTDDRMEVLVQRCLRDAIGQQNPDVMVKTVCHAMLESKENKGYKALNYMLKLKKILSFKNCFSNFTTPNKIQRESKADTYILKFTCLFQ